jgi:molecular chaperone Hsp33
MIAKNEAADVTCQICGKPYNVSVAEIAEIRDRIHRQSMH